MAFILSYSSDYSAILSATTVNVDHLSEFTVGHSIVLDNNWTAAGRTCADLGTITTCNIDGGNIDNTVIGLTSPSMGSFDEVFVTETTGGVLSIGRADVSVASADEIGTISFIAKDTDAQGGTYESVAAIKCIATEDFDDADDAGTKLSFLVNPIGSETPQEEMSLSGEVLKIDHIAELSGAHNVIFDTGVIVTLAADDQLYINASTTPSTNTNGALYVDCITSTAAVEAANISNRSTALTGGNTNCAINTTMWSDSVVTADNPVLNGIYALAQKTGADSTAGTVIVRALHAVAQSTGSTDAGIKNTYGVYADATGDGAGTSTAYGLYAVASGADANWAAYLAGNTAITGELDMTGASALIDMNPAITGSGNLIDITPSAAIITQDAIVHGIHMDASNLDPTQPGTFLSAIYIDNSDILMTQLPTIIGVSINSPKAGATSHSYIKALNLSEGKVYHSYTSGSSPASDYDIYDIQIDASAQHSSSESCAISLNCPTIPVGTVVGLSTHSYTYPILQTLRTFTTPDQAGADSYAGRLVGAAYTAGIDGNEIFVSDNDSILIGAVDPFNDLQVVMTTAATINTLPTFWYYDTDPKWVQFYPNDGTIGFRKSGDIAWLNAGFTNWNPNGDPAGADGATGYWIKISRTRNADPGTPTPATIKLATTTTSATYNWNPTGDLSVRNISATKIASTGGISVNRTAVTADIAAGAAVTNYMYFGWDGAAADTITISSEDIAVSGRMFIIKDEGGTASANPLTIATEAAEKIDGNDTVQLTINYGYLWLISNGSNLFILGGE